MAITNHANTSNGGSAKKQTEAGKNIHNNETSAGTTTKSAARPTRDNVAAKPTK